MGISEVINCFMYQASMPVLSMVCAVPFFTTFFLRLGGRFLPFLGPAALPNFPPGLPPNLPPLPGLPCFPPNDFFFVGLRPPLNIGIKTPVLLFTRPSPFQWKRRGWTSLTSLFSNGCDSVLNIAPRFRVGLRLVQGPNGQVVLERAHVTVGHSEAGGAADRRVLGVGRDRLVGRDGVFVLVAQEPDAPDPQVGAFGQVVVRRARDHLLIFGQRLSP